MRRASNTSVRPPALPSTIDTPLALVDLCEDDKTLPVVFRGEEGRPRSARINGLQLSGWAPGRAATLAERVCSTDTTRSVARARGCWDGLPLPRTLAEPEMDTRSAVVAGCLGFAPSRGSAGALDHAAAVGRLTSVARDLSVALGPR